MFSAYYKHDFSLVPNYDKKNYSNKLPRAAKSVVGVAAAELVFADSVLVVSPMIVGQ